MSPAARRGHRAAEIGGTRGIVGVGDRRSAPGPIVGTGGSTGRRDPGQPDIDGGSPADVGPGWGLVTPFGLARRSVGAGTLALFAISASSPMTVLAGGIVATYAATGVIAVPLSFLLLAAALGLFSLGFAAMVRDTPHAASFTALLTRGLGTTTGAVGSAVALLSYNAVQIGLYGLFGATSVAQTAGLPLLAALPWWSWAGLAWLVVTVLGVFHVQLSARIVGAVLCVELTVIVLFDVVGLGEPAAPGPGSTSMGAVTAPLRIDLLTGSGLGGVLALGVAAFIGFETVAAFREEVRHPASIRPALTGTVAFLGVFYAMTAWALAAATGPDRIVDATRDPATGPDLPFTLLADRLGPAAAVAGRTLLRRRRE